MMRVRVVEAREDERGLRHEHVLAEIALPPGKDLTFEVVPGEWVSLRQIKGSFADALDAHKLGVRAEAEIEVLSEVRE